MADPRFDADIWALPIDLPPIHHHVCHLPTQGRPGDLWLCPRCQRMYVAVEALCLSGIAWDPEWK